MTSDAYANDRTIHPVDTNVQDAAQNGRAAEITYPARSAESCVWHEARGTSRFAPATRHPEAAGTAGGGRLGGSGGGRRRISLAKPAACAHRTTLSRLDSACVSFQLRSHFIPPEIASFHLRAVSSHPGAAPSHPGAA